MEVHHTHARGVRPACPCHHQQPKILHSLLSPSRHNDSAAGADMVPRQQHQHHNHHHQQHHHHSPATNMGVNQSLLKSHLQGKLHNYNYPNQMTDVLNNVAFTVVPSNTMHAMSAMANRTVVSDFHRQLAYQHNQFSQNASPIPQHMDRYTRPRDGAPISPSLPQINNHTYRQRSGSTSSCGSSSSGSSSVNSKMTHSYSSTSSMSDRYTPSPYSPFTDLDSGYSSSNSSSPVTSGDSDAYPVRLSPSPVWGTSQKEHSQNIENSKLFSILSGQGMSHVPSTSDKVSKNSTNEEPKNLSTDCYTSKKRPYEDDHQTGEVEQEQPMDLTCKRPKIEQSHPINLVVESKYQTSVNDCQQTYLPHISNSPLPTCSPGPQSPKSAASSRPQSRAQTPLTAAGSMLKQLLNGTMFSGCQEEESVEEIDEDNQPFARSNTPVTIAKKNLFPVSARVSDWVVKAVQFATSLPEFSNLTHNDKVTLLLNSWARVMLVQMAETNFQFVVTPVVGDKKGDQSENAPSLSAEIPTMSSVDTIQGFIKKCQSMGLDNREFSFIKAAALFNSGYSGVLDNIRYVDEVNSCLRQSLQDHIQSSSRGRLVRYSQILMCLPTLFGINCKMVGKSLLQAYYWQHGYASSAQRDVTKHLIIFRIFY